jgi:hypothetical protein
MRFPRRGHVCRPLAFLRGDAQAEEREAELPVADAERGFDLAAGHVGPPADDVGGAEPPDDLCRAVQVHVYLSLCEDLTGERGEQGEDVR